MNALSRVLIAPLLALPLSCGSSLFSSDIAELRANSRDYDGKSVTVSGKVAKPLNAMFLRVFVVEDDTGHIYVWTDRAVPNEGEDIRVTGTFHQVMMGGMDDAIREFDAKPDDGLKPNTVRPELMCCLRETSD